MRELEARIQERSINHMATLPKPPEVFKRDKDAPQISHFSAGVKDICVVPVRAELRNDHLAEYLTIMQRQELPNDGQKLGLVFLVNDHAGDQNNINLLEENNQTMRYLSYLARKEMPPGGPDIPQNYKDIAEEIIGNDAIEIRVDYVHSEQDLPNFGALRLHLINLAGALKNPLTSDSDTVLHFHDVDSRMRRTHLLDLRKIYDDNPELRFNITEFDLSPGKHEDVEEGGQDISQDLLLHLDDYRLYQYGKLTRLFIFGLRFSGSPTQSGKFSYFFKNGRINPLITYTLEEWAINRLVRK
jgi:hypothetical protein